MNIQTTPMNKALIAMAVYNTAENKKFEVTKRTIDGLINSYVDHRHDLYIIDNGSYHETIDYILSLPKRVTKIFNGANIGTARAINKAWQFRKEGQHAIKMDDDVIIHSDNWVEQMIEAIDCDHNIGIVGLKRKDCWENPKHEEEDYKSTLIQLPHTPGSRWINVEVVRHVIGTCQMYNSALLDKMGFLYQPSLYGYDDVIASHKSQIAGFYNCFLNHIDIDHIDEGKTPYQSWKEKHSSEVTQEVINFVHQMIRGEREIYQPFY